MQLKHWQYSGNPQQKSRRTSKAMRRKRRQLMQLRRRLKTSKYPEIHSGKSQRLGSARK